MSAKKKNKNWYEIITKEVNETITGSEYGFTSYEIGLLIMKLTEKHKEFKKFNREKYYNAMTGNTCIAIKGQIINYHCDVITGLVCGIENRDISPTEWD